MLTRTRGRVDAYFGVSENGSTMRRELMAGTVTFLAMSYLLAVNPAVLGDQGALGDKGIPIQAVFTATAATAVFGTLVMGLWARYPIALAPGMGLNAFFAYSVVLEMGIPWQVALSGTFISGVVFFVLAVTKVRERILNAIPMPMRFAVGAGIGMFVVFLVIGWHGAVLYGIVLTAGLGIVTGLVDLPDGIAAQMAVVILTMLFVDFFDCGGTLIGVANQAGLLDEDGKLPRAASAFAAHSVGTMAGAVIGTSTTTAYVESTAGVCGRPDRIDGDLHGRMVPRRDVLLPVFAVVAGSPEITAPALIVVGVLMSRALGEIDWNQLEYSIPAFITVVMMPLTYSIANGLAIGMLFYPVVMVAKGRVRDVYPAMWVLTVVLLGYFFFLAE
ncbi:NCS2 family permease [Nocardia sp. NBC_01377]|uniref:NCS2 family permease n=1 Tax=Nocardia sp. NBC_01377 TaxID=2903595 RepID=UPI00386D607C